jgi:hypothetical protein
MKFHIIVEANNSHDRIAEFARLAESFGMEGIWSSNMHDSRDPFINFVEAARTTIDETPLWRGFCGQSFRNPFAIRTRTNP